VDALNLYTIVPLAKCLVEALARREAADQAPQRLGKLDDWKAFKGHMDHSHLLGLLAEDTAVRFPLPADAAAVAESPSAPSFGRVTDSQAQGMIFHAKKALDLTQRDTLISWGKRLERRGWDVPRKVQSTMRVLELPGTGGLLAARALEKTDDAYLHTNFTVLAQDWRDRAMAGLVAMEHNAPNTDFVFTDPELTWATDSTRRNTFDLVLGLSDTHGGRWSEATLKERFPRADIALV
jgi:hypothetical protein